MPYGIKSFLYTIVMVLHYFFSLQLVGPLSWLMMWEVTLRLLTTLTHISTVNTVAGSLWHKSHVREEHVPFLL